MKNIILVLVCLLFISTVSNGQYRLNKKKYDYHSFRYQTGDPYNPSVAGFASLLIPGMGQMTSGELGRGAAFFGGFIGCIALIAVGSASYYEMDGITYGGPALIYLGFFGIIAIDIVSVVDAVRVAKVNDLRFRERIKTGYNVQLSPYFGSLNNDKVPLGLSLKIRF